jgi:hypothetical protein
MTGSDPHCVDFTFFEPAAELKKLVLNDLIAEVIGDLGQRADSLVLDHGVIRACNHLQRSQQVSTVSLLLSFMLRSLVATKIFNKVSKLFRQIHH